MSSIFKLKDIVLHLSQEDFDHSPRVRNIVTPQGRAPRGHFPCLKSATYLKYESLCEEDVLRCMVVAPAVSAIETQPRKYKIRRGTKQMRYTPDIEAEIFGKRFLIEVKHKDFARDAAVVERLRHIIQHMRSIKTRFSIVLDSDVRANGLQDELRELMRYTCPPRARYTRQGSNESPNLVPAVPNDIEKRWATARQVCDDLLRRVMRRDPDELLPETNS